MVQPSFGGDTHEKLRSHLSHARDIIYELGFSINGEREMGAQKLLLNIGMVFLSLSLASTIYLGPYAESIVLQKEHSQAFLGIVAILIGLLM